MLDLPAFQYDQQAPLDLTILAERSQDDTIIRDIA